MAGFAILGLWNKGDIIKEYCRVTDAGGRRNNSEDRADQAMAVITKWQLLVAGKI